MKASWRWLCEMVDPRADVHKVADRLTRGGLEVESITPFGEFSGVVIGEVYGKRPHPNASKLTLVDVWDGRDVTQVVCGAPNVPEPGGLVAWARPGARLKGGVLLAEKEVRGIVSPGMLCAEDEIGLGEGHAGILVFSRADGMSPGDDLAEKLGLPDHILEVNVTPNRPDCLGHVGIAREIAALYGTRLTHSPGIAVADVSEPERSLVEIVDTYGCPRYTAFLIEDVTVGPSPLKVRLRLQALGVRAISNVVDATNLVMLETGQPLHAFDLDKLAGGRIVVRRARDGEKLTTLDGAEHALKTDDLVIADADRPVALAGVMGGADTEVTGTTRRVLLECAYFDPTRIRRMAKRLGMHSEASHRFERGTDPNRVPRAAYTCASSIVELSAVAPGSDKPATVRGAIVDAYVRRIEPVRITLRAGRTRQILGVEEGLDLESQARLLRQVGLETEGAGEDMLHVTVPTFRPDLTREIDLVEEIARLYGYDRITSSVPPLRELPGPLGDALPRRVADALVAAGLEEIVTYGFVSPHSIAALGHDDWRAQPVRLHNPLREEQSAMRTTLLPGLLAALERNVVRGESDVRIFEVGTVFRPLEREAALPTAHPRKVAGLLAGRRDGWLKPGRALEFFDARGVIEALADQLACPVAFKPAGQIAWLHPGVQAWVETPRPAGVVGQLHPDVLSRFGIDASVRAFAFELDLDAIGQAHAPQFVPLPRFPQVARDLSFFIDEGVTALEIRTAIDELKDALCVEVQVLDDYREAGRVPTGKKSMLWSFIYRAPDRTLTDAEVAERHEALVKGLTSRLDLDVR